MEARPAGLLFKVIEMLKCLIILGRLIFQTFRLLKINKSEFLEERIFSTCKRVTKGRFEVLVNISGPVAHHVAPNSLRIQ